MLVTAIIKPWTQPAHFHSVMIIKIKPLRWRKKAIIKTSQMAQVDRVSASGAVDWGFDSESGQTNDFKKLVFAAASLLLTFSIKGTVWRTSWQVRLLCRWERHLTGFPHLGVVDKCLAPPKQARIVPPSLSCDRRIKMLKIIISNGLIPLAFYLLAKPVLVLGNQNMFGLT